MSDECKVVGCTRSADRSEKSGLCRGHAESVRLGYCDESGARVPEVAAVSVWAPMNPGEIDLTGKEAPKGGVDAAEDVRKELWERARQGCRREVKPAHPEAILWLAERHAAAPSENTLALLREAVGYAAPHQDDPSA